MLAEIECAFTATALIWSHEMIEGRSWAFERQPAGCQGFRFKATVNKQ